jgi:dihydroorotate dehydrogenase
MPDWSYRTLLRPMLFALPPESARRLSIGVLAGLGRIPGGRAFIDVLGHMRADERLAQGPWRAPVGLGALLDPDGAASGALARFGVGFIEVGPVRVQAPVADVTWLRDASARTLQRQGPRAVGLAHVQAQLAANVDPLVARWVRIDAAESEPAHVVSALQPWAAGFTLELDASHDVALRVEAARSATDKPLLVSLRADHAQAAAAASAALGAGASGVWVRGELADGVHGASALPHVIETVRALSAQLPAGTTLVAGGVDQPEDVRQLARAGAQLYAVDSGLVFSGPGLIKRCNEALLCEAHGADAPALPALTLQAARSAWFWALCLGVAMFVGGMLALTIANTRVVLPYDEALCGMKRSELAALNPRLLPFMRHDRMTLAGTMLSIGVLYSALALHALRRGAHWAHVSLIVSALAGFVSLFAFLGFGYFDPFHAFVAAVLFQLLLLCVLTPLGAAHAPPVAQWRETRAWRAGLWGQLLFVMMGVGLIGAGAVILFIGCSAVFVREDLEFMRTTAAELLVAHERLVPLVAHDRATLGGMLLANGLVVLLCALWGMRAGERWLWHALAWAGSLAFASAIGVHYIVGYDSLFHLAPAFVGFAVWWLALGLSRAWLCGVQST